MTKIDGIAASPYAHTGKTNNTAYYYRVTSVTGNCESAASSLVNATPSATSATTGGTATTSTGTATTAPSAPANVTAAAADGQVTLSWSAVTGATSYKVYLGSATGVTVSNATINTNTTATSLTQTGLTNGTAYYFIVTASNSAGESTASIEVSAKPAAATTKPAAPSGVTATAGNTQVTVTWTAVTGATSYTVYYGTSTGVTKANATGNATSAVASLTKTSLTNGTAYYFIVTASNAVGESAASSEVSATPAISVSGAWPTSLINSLVSYWKLDGNSNDSVAANNGTDTAITYSTGARNQAASINGTTSEINVGNLGGINDYSVSMWFKKGVASGYPSGGVFEADMFGTQNTTTIYQYFKFGWHTSYVDQPLIAIATTSSDYRLVTAPAITDTSWHHIVVVRAGSSLNAYIDGVAVTLTARTTGGAPTATISTGNPTKFGTVGGVTDAHFNGSIDEVGVWNRVLTSTEVTNLYNGGVGLPYQSNLMGGAIQKSLTLTGAVTTIAGSPGVFGTTDATGTAARFKNPDFITTDGTNLYLADQYNSTIRQVVIATGAVTTLAGSAGITGSTDGTGAAARFNLPEGITTDGTNLYVADATNNIIRKVVIATGVVTTLAGSSGVSGSTDGTGTAARFYWPQGLTTDGTNLYVATHDHTIRKIVIATGVVTTLAGSAGVIGSTDGAGTASRFYFPLGITTDGTNLYVTDYSNHTVRKMVIATGVLTTLAGSAGTSGTTDGAGTAARFKNPQGITTDGTNLYISDGNNQTIRQVVIATGAVTTLAGSAGTSGTTDGTGIAARFLYPLGITTDGTSLFATDWGNHTIRKIQ